MCTLVVTDVPMTKAGNGSPMRRISNQKSVGPALWLALTGVWMLMFVFPALSGAGHAAPLLNYRVAEVRPHDSMSFTQGLLLHDGLIHESSGLYGRSFVRVWDPRAGAVLKEASLSERLFAEGLALAGDDLVVLTWREGVALRLDARSLAVKGTFAYRGQGWGLAFDGQRFIHSDGSEYLVFRHAETFKAAGRVRVTDDGKPVRRLNELEWVPARTPRGPAPAAIAGKLLANVWLSTRIAVIDPGSGRVEAWIDLSRLAAEAGNGNPDAVANGVAFDARTGRLLVTGKLWSRLYELELLE